MPLTAGARLGAYEILAPLGAGGMGEVYRARDTRLDRTVAIKVLPPHIASDSQLRERFDREARTISQLNNSHICAIYDLGETAVTRTDGGPGPESAERVNFLVFEYLPGQTLADRLKQGPVAVTEAIDIATQIADALADAHGHAI